MFNIFVSLSINSSFDFSITVEYVALASFVLVLTSKNIHYQFYQYNNHQPYRDLTLVKSNCVIPNCKQIILSFIF
jgi:hypothetical protein